MSTTDDQFLAATAVKWWAKGLLFENCDCQVVCPGHFHFSQLCTHDRCVGYWGISFEDGDFGGVRLAGLTAIIIYDTPQHMVSGNWIITTYVDERASAEQQAAIEKIVSGEANGPWKILAQFVSERKPTRRAAIEFKDTGKVKTLTAGNFFRSAITWLKGRDREAEVQLVNSFNQIHNSTQTLNTGSTEYTDGAFSIVTKNSHALHSRFSWSGEY
jgi:X-X-X-Leu-X-X-Gly heptad repeat protein